MVTYMNEGLFLLVAFSNKIIHFLMAQTNTIFFFCTTSWTSLCFVACGDGDDWLGLQVLVVCHMVPHGVIDIVYLDVLCTNICITPSI